MRARPLIDSAARGSPTLVQAMGAPCALSPALEAPDWAGLAAVREQLARARGRRPDAEAARGAVPRRPQARRLVEVEDRSVQRGRGADLRAAGQRPPLQPVHRLHVRASGKARELVPFAKAYSGLSDAEIAELDRWIRRHTVERFGPVRHVEPVHVFELGFEGISRSSRHRSGVAVRFPRILRWRKDKTRRAGGHAGDGGRH